MSKAVSKNNDDLVLRSGKLVEVENAEASLDNRTTQHKMKEIITVEKWLKRMTTTTIIRGRKDVMVSLFTTLTKLMFFEAGK
mmetsp:Transcript_11396/g.20133  ORF Transcript_11396/g.20133 Transcript_11396/m.20133 type:complete len:82 (-) Transcript_11396:90-335(-)